MDVPAETGPELAVEHGPVDGRVRPAPEGAVGFPVRPHEIAGHHRRLAYAQRQTFGFHTVLHGEHALLEQLTRAGVCCLRGIQRDGAGLLRKGEVWITGTVRIEHRRIARQGRGNAELLLGPIDIRHRIAWWWPDQSADPGARPKDKSGIARLVAAGA